MEFVGLQLTITDVLVRVEMFDGRTWATIARPSQPWFEIAASQTWLEVAGTYIVQGIRQIVLRFSKCSRRIRPIVSTVIILHRP